MPLKNEWLYTYYYYFKNYFMNNLTNNTLMATLNWFWLQTFLIRKRCLCLGRKGCPRSNYSVYYKQLALNVHGTPLFHSLKVLSPFIHIATRTIPLMKDNTFINTGG